MPRAFHRARKTNLARAMVHQLAYQVGGRFGETAKPLYSEQA